MDCAEARRVMRRLFLGSASAAALLAGGTTAADAVGCAITQNGGTAASVTNSAAINCIDIFNNATVTGSVTNAAPGTITATGGGQPFSTGITVNGSTIGGTIVNAGTIDATNGGILIDGAAIVGAGVQNTGTISVSAFNGIVLNSLSSFGGGISNTGTIATNRTAIGLLLVSTFSGDISNAGTITSSLSRGLKVLGVQDFTGGVTNSGTISAGTQGMLIDGISSFSGNIVNTGTGVISSAGANGIAVGQISLFGGGITNAGTITSANTAIELDTSTTFAGGISNSGTISSSRDGIMVLSDTQFGSTSAGGGIVNSGTIAAHSDAVYVQTLATFQGGVTNSGSISTSGRAGIAIAQVTDFSGGIVNSGSGEIAALDEAILVASVSTFSGGISNAGTIALTNGDAVLMTAVGAFSGGITNSGTLNVGSGIVLLNSTSFAGNVSNSGTITAELGAINIQGISTFAGGIGNSGTIVSRSSAAISVFGISTFTGGIVNSGTISAGAGIQVSSSITQFGNSSAGGGITNTGTISVKFTGIGVIGVSTFAGSLTNAGTGMIVSASGNALRVTSSVQFGSNKPGGGIVNAGLIKSSAQTAIVVSSISTFQAGITNTGTIVGTTGLSVVASGPVSIVDSGTIDGTNGTAINLVRNAAGNTVMLEPGYAITGLVEGQGNDTLALGGTGSGAFDLNTVGTQYTGFSTFNVTSGTWTVSGTDNNDWTVMTGGTLQGAATVHNLQVNSGGALAPGNPAPGSAMTVNGNLTLQAGSTYVVQVAPAGATIANVSGTATLGGTVDAVFAGGTYSPTQYDVLHAASLDGTTFASLQTLGLSPQYRASLVYTATDVFLKLSLNQLTLAGLSANQKSVGGAINAFTLAGGTLPASFAPLFNLSGATLGNALSQIAGEAATGASDGAFAMNAAFFDTVLAPFASGGEGWSHEARLDNAPASVHDAQLLPSAGWSTWFSGFGGGATTDGVAAAGTHDVNAHIYGLAAGAEYRFTPDLVFGGALGWGGDTWGLSQGLGGGQGDVLQAALYGATRNGPLYVNGAISFANYWVTTHRIAFGSDVLLGHYTAQSYSGRLEGGWRFDGGPDLGLTPYVAIQAQNFYSPAYSETDVTGGGFGLSFASARPSSTQSELGLRADETGLSFAGTDLVLRGRAAWAHDWNATPLLGASFETLPGASFLVAGAKPSQDSVLTSASVELDLATALTFRAGFDGQFGSRSQTYIGSGTLRYTW